MPDDIKSYAPDHAIREILKRSNYPEYLRQYSKTESDYVSRLENIDQLIYSASQKKTIVEYLEEAALIREDKEDEEDDDNFGVNLSTIHASKGLEYLVVFIVGCEEQLFPHWKSINSDQAIQEERRLMYVGLTRDKFRSGNPGRTKTHVCGVDTGRALSVFDLFGI